MTRSLVLIPRHGDRQFLTKEQAEELLAGVPDYVEPVAEKPVVVPAAIEFAGGNPVGAGKSVVSDKPLVFSPAGSVVFDDPSSYDNPPRTQGRHILSYNRTGRVMACLPDYFAAGLANDKDLIINLRHDFYCGVVCGDRFFYKFNSADAKIIRPYGSTVVKPETVNFFAHRYFGDSLDETLATTNGKVFVRNLFRIDPSLNNDDIANVFLNLTGLSGDRVRLRTPDYTDRLSNTKKVAFLILYNDFFDIFCDRGIYFDGISHTVHYIPNGGGVGQ